jgi:plasmid stabilization system protein ParE
MKIEWTEPDVSDMEMVRDYIAKDSEFYALRFVERVFEVLEKVSVFPNSGRIVPEAEDSSIREILFYSYRIMYRIKDEKILVLTVIHGARDLGSIEPKPWNETY